MIHSQYLAPYMTVRMMEVKNKLSWHMISTQEMFSRKYTAAANVCFYNLTTKLKIVNVFNYFLMTNVLME